MTERAESPRQELELFMNKRSTIDDGTVLILRIPRAGLHLYPRLPLCKKGPNLTMGAEARNQITIYYDDDTSHKVDRRVVHMR